MHRRKLQSTGGASLTLTLPKSWTSYWMLAGKDEVLVHTRGHALVIKPAATPQQEIVSEILLDNLPDKWVVREMVGTYIAGADRIILHGERITSTQNQLIRQTVQLLFGFEILDESSQRIVTRSVLDDTQFPVSDSTMRIFSIVHRMFEDALTAVQTNDTELALDIKQRDFEVNKFLHAVKRQYQEILSEKVEGDLNMVSFYQNVAIQLERIGDHAVKIAHLAGTEWAESITSSKAFPAIKEHAHKLLEDVEVTVQNLDKEQAHKILDSDTALEDIIHSSTHMKKSYEGALIEDSIDRLRGYLMNIAELIIDYKLVENT